MKKESADLIKQIRVAGLQSPETMTLMVTNGCNLHCRHCWMDCSPLKSATAVATSEILHLIDAFADLGGTCIKLTGGEILTHPDCHQILRFCSDHARINGVGLQTNATLITRKHLEALLELQPDKLTIQVSLDGARAKTHDFVRGPGSYADTMAGLRMLVDVGLGPRTQVAFTEMAHNFCELPQLLEKTNELGIGHLVSSTLIKGGRAAASAQIRQPIPAQYWELIQLYQTDAIFKKLYDQTATIAAVEWFKNRSKPTAGSCGCLKNLFVDTRGCLYPCTMLLMDRYASESVYANPLVQTIAKTLSKWREIPTLSRKRQSEIPTCSRCTCKSHCGGGCMGRAATICGELMVPEDRCSLRKAVYHWTKLPSAGSFCRKG